MVACEPLDQFLQIVRVRLVGVRAGHVVVLQRVIADHQRAGGIREVDRLAAEDVAVQRQRGMVLADVEDADVGAVVGDGRRLQHVGDIAAAGADVEGASVHHVLGVDDVAAGVDVEHAVVVQSLRIDCAILVDRGVGSGIQPALHRQLRVLSDGQDADASEANVQVAADADRAGRTLDIDIARAAGDVADVQVAADRRAGSGQDGQFAHAGIADRGGPGDVRARCRYRRD